MKKNLSEFLEAYGKQYSSLCKRKDDRWKSAIEQGCYWLHDCKVGAFLDECAKARGDYFSSDKEIAAVFYTLAELNLLPIED